MYAEMVESLTTIVVASRHPATASKRPAWGPRVARKRARAETAVVATRRCPGSLREYLGHAHAVELLQKGGCHRLGVADYGGLGRVIPARHRRVHVDLYEPRRQAHLPVLGVRTLKTRPDRYQEVRFATQGSDVGVPGEVANATGMVLGDNPPPVRARE